MSRQVGNQKELEAGAFLKEKGFKLIASNHTTKFGEIDLIAIDGQVLVFIEVKYRSNDRHGKAVEYVTPSKIAKMKRAAWHFIQNAGDDLPQTYRMDVVGIDGDKMTHYQNITI